jgi:mRNA export factor
MESDLLEDLLHVEEQFYQEGYALGLADGAQAGYAEGAVFAVEKSFEKLVELGKLYGKSLVWAQRLRLASTSAQPPPPSSAGGTDLNDPTQTGEHAAPTHAEECCRPAELCASMAPLPGAARAGSRLEKHVRALLALLDPATLALENSEDAIAELESRLHSAARKAKLVQRALGERDAAPGSPRGDSEDVGSIEDISVLGARH